MSLLVNSARLKEDITGNKYEIFLQEFPDAKAELEKLKTQPSCGQCEKEVIPKIFSDPKADQKLKLIYGDDVVIDKVIPPQPQYEQSVEVHRIPMPEYEEWFKETMKQNSEKVVRMVTTAYRSKDDTMIVSIVAMVKTN